MPPATFDTPTTFWRGSSGKWAGEQMLRAMQADRPINASVLRTNDVLRKDEWKFFDEEIAEEVGMRLRGVADLYAAGLTRSVPNALGKTVYEYEKIGDMDPAIVSLDGMTRSENDRPEFTLAGIPLPITHKDFFINIRTLMASRNRGEGLDATAARVSARKVAEETERMLFNGGKTFGGYTIYGYTTHPSRNTDSFGTNGNWAQSAKTGENVLADVLAMIAKAEADLMFGPYWLYVASDASTKLESDFKANSTLSTRQRLLQIDRLQAIRVVDQMTAANVVLVQATPDVVVMVDGEQYQTVQWDVEGGFGVNFKAFAIQVPLVRSTADGRSGIVHFS